MKISVIIPAYNEENTIYEVITKVQKTPFEKEIIVVDDGSTDRTGEILKDFDDRVIVVSHEKNKGKGAAIRSALKRVTGDVIIIQDADLEYDPKEYRKLIEPLIRQEAAVVYGSRNLRMDGKSRDRNPVSSLSFYLGGVFLSKLANFLYGIKITDESTGYKVFKTEVIKNLVLEGNRFEFCPEVTAKLTRKGYKIKEVPISYCPRSFSQGKKIRWWDGLIAIFSLIKHRFR